MTKSLTALVCAVALTIGGVALGAPASAASVTLKDPQQKFSQGPALDLEQARFGFGEKSVVYRLSIEQLSRRNTQVFARLYLDDSDLLLSSRFDARGRQQTSGVLTTYRTESTQRFTRGVTARWNFAADVVTITLTKAVVGDSARLAAYTAPKGSQHGPARGDYITTRLQRG